MNRNLISAPVIPAIGRAALVVATGIASPAGAEVMPDACQLPSAQYNPLIAFQGKLSAYGDLPEHCLKSMFISCSAAAEREVLAAGTVMVCSIGYEALLRRVFSGDFHALLAWWRSERGEPGDLSP